MIYGITNSGERVLATKNTEATCPHCKINLISKCGNIKVHHWAHKDAKDCPYAGGMTKWHYDWLINFDNRLSEGWKIEYFFDSIRFDAYNPAKKQAIEFQRIIDLDYMANKINICQNTGIKLLWVINHQIFQKFIYTNKFIGEKCHTLFASRRCKRKISTLLEKYISNKHVEFLIDFKATKSLPKYSTNNFNDRFVNIHDKNSKNYKHPMTPGIYIIREMPLLKDYYYRKNCVLFLKYHTKGKA